MDNTPPASLLNNIVLHDISLIGFHAANFPSQGEAQPLFALGFHIDDYHPLLGHPRRKPQPEKKRSIVAKRIRLQRCSTVPDRRIMEVEACLLSPRQLIIRRQRHNAMLRQLLQNNPTLLNRLIEGIDTAFKKFRTATQELAAAIPRVLSAQNILWESPLCTHHSTANHKQ